MIRTIVLTIFVGAACVACHSTTGPYQPVTAPEKIEFSKDRIDVYPDEVRKNPAAYIGEPVVWVGIIRNTQAYELDSHSKIRVETLFEHHYFDWVEDGKGKCAHLAVSPRGEGFFRMVWYLNKTRFDATAGAAERYANRDKLAIVYGAPEKVEPDGAIDLKYHYIRILNQDQYTTNAFDYGRLGEPFYTMKPQAKIGPPPQQN